MADRTKIEWARHPGTGRGATWNPIRARNIATGRIGTHCEHVNEACRNCYAERDNRNPRNLPFGGTGLDFKPGNRGKVELFLDERVLALPLRWREPRGIFVCSTTDLYGDWVPRGWLDRIRAVQALTPQHLYFELTKRPQRAAEYSREWFGRFAAGGVMVDHPTGRRDVADLLDWAVLPDVLPNVCAGTSASDQPEADALVSQILQVKAALHFASMEPLLGRIDLRAFVPNAWKIKAALRGWDDFAWPAWVPQKVRGEIESFWRAEYGRGPDSWMAGAIANGQPPMGSQGSFRTIRSGEPTVEGRFVPAWNNIGRVVGDDGQTHVVSAGTYQSRPPTLGWVIAGGESGPAARPMHPDWARGLRDQCQAAGVPFFFKQWGEHLPHGQQLVDRSLNAIGNPDDAAWTSLGGGESAYRVGRRRSGRSLDGVVHDAMPAFGAAAARAA